MMRMQRMTARARLTTFYGAFFLLSGMLLIALILAIGFSQPQHSPRHMPAHPLASRSEVRAHIIRARAEARSELKQRLVAASGLALVGMTAIALFLGWFMAGRVLKPIRSVSSTARRISDQSLDERIPVSGPNDELKELAETFNGMIARLERAFTAQRSFTANASHELRAPMTTQRALVEVSLATPGMSSDAQTLAHDLHAVLLRQEQLLNGLFELSCGQHGPERQEAVALDKVAHDALERWRSAGKELDVIEELNPSTVSGDPVLLEILVDNLIRNAIVHNQPGGWVRVRTSDGEIFVENTGVQLSPQRLAELIEPFRRGTRDRTASGTGSGLGLAIVDTIARAHGGSLRLLARPDGGVIAAVRPNP